MQTCKWTTKAKRDVEWERWDLDRDQCCSKSPIEFRQRRHLQPWLSARQSSFSQLFPPLSGRRLGLRSSYPPMERWTGEEQADIKIEIERSVGWKRNRNENGGVTIPERWESPLERRGWVFGKVGGDFDEKMKRYMCRVVEVFWLVVGGIK